MTSSVFWLSEEQFGRLTPLLPDDSLDARIVLLALHSGVIVSDVADRFEVETD